MECAQCESLPTLAILTEVCVSFFSVPPTNVMIVLLLGHDYVLPMFPSYPTIQCCMEILKVSQPVKEPIDTLSFTKLSLVESASDKLSPKSLYANCLPHVTQNS